MDRFLGLVVHVVSHTAQSRSIRLSAHDEEDLIAEVLLTVIANDFAILRRFRGDSSLATYLTVVARRVVVREMLRRKNPSTLAEAQVAASENRQQEVVHREQIEHLLDSLNGSEADIVRLYHLEGKSYQEISSKVGMPENSIGPTLSRARAKMRRASGESV